MVQASVYIFASVKQSSNDIVYVYQLFNQLGKVTGGFYGIFRKSVLQNRKQLSVLALMVTKSGFGTEVFAPKD